MDSEIKQMCQQKITTVMLRKIAIARLLAILCLVHNQKTVSTGDTI